MRVRASSRGVASYRVRVTAGAGGRSKDVVGVGTCGRCGIELITGPAARCDIYPVYSRRARTALTVDDVGVGARARCVQSAAGVRVPRNRCGRQRTLAVDVSATGGRHERALGVLVSAGTLSGNRAASVRVAGELRSGQDHRFSAARAGQCASCKARSCPGSDGRTPTHVRHTGVARISAKRGASGQQHGSQGNVWGLVGEWGAVAQVPALGGSDSSERDDKTGCEKIS